MFRYKSHLWDLPDFLRRVFLFAMSFGWKWLAIGPSHTVRFNHTHIELKVDANVPDINASGNNVVSKLKP